MGPGKPRNTGATFEEEVDKLFAREGEEEEEEEDNEEQE